MRVSQSSESTLKNILNEKNSPITKRPIVGLNLKKPIVLPTRLSVILRAYLVAKLSLFS